MWADYGNSRWRRTVFKKTLLLGRQKDKKEKKKAMNEINGLNHLTIAPGP